MANSGKPNNDRPAYQPWYESDFWTRRVRALPHMARLMYRAILQSAWDQELPGIIPNDVPTIMAMADCPDERTWKKHEKSLMAMFDLSEDGTSYTNKRQMDELQKYYAKLVSWSERGKKGNDVRWHGNPKKTRKKSSTGDSKGSLHIAKASYSDPLATISDPPPVSQPVQTSPDQSRPSNTSCSEVVSELVAIFLPLNDDSEYPVPEKSAAEWRTLYPAVDVTQELRKMRGWLTASPKRRKTDRGIEKFINSWLSRAQDNPKGAARFVAPPALGPVNNAAADQELERQLGRKPQ